MFKRGANDCRRPPQRSLQGYDLLRSLGTEKCGDIVEAYLAAADAAQRLNVHMNFAGGPWHREYKDLVGGTFNETDEAARYINAWVKDECEKQPPTQRSKSLRRHSK